MYVSNNKSVINNSFNLFRENILSKFNSVEVKVTVVALAVFALIMTGLSIYLCMANRKLRAQSNTTVIPDATKGKAGEEGANSIQQNGEKGKQSANAASSPLTPNNTKSVQGTTPSKTGIPSKMTLSVRTGPSGKDRTEYQVYLEETIGSLKARMHERQGILPWENRLIFNTTELENHVKIKDYYRNLEALKKDPLITTVPNDSPPLEKRVLKIKTRHGDVECDAYFGDTIDCLKARIHEKKFIPSWDISLRYEGQLLPDDASIDDYEFDDKNPINLFNKTQKIPDYLPE